METQMSNGKTLSHAAIRAAADAFNATALAPPLPPARWVLVSPELAAEWLARGKPRNRSLTSGTVALYRELMRGDNWDPLYDPIMFRAEDASVGNGQHRLTAQVQEGLTLWWSVVEGATQRMIDNADCGRPRRVSDRLSIEGESNAISVAARVSMVVKLEAGLPTHSSKANKHAIADAMRRYRAPLDWSLSAIPHGGRSRPFSASSAGAMVYAYRTAPALAERFVAQVRTGELLRRGDPALTFREYMSNGAGCFAGGSSATTAIAVATLRAFSAAVQGEELKQLKPTMMSRETVEELIAAFAIANTTHS